MKKRLTKKAPIRKYEGGGVATAQTKEEQAKSAMDLLTKKPVTSSTPTPVVKKRADGFESDAQKAAYIKNAKSMLSKGKTVADLVSSKFGTAAGLKALGITDSKPATSNKTTAPAKTYQSKKDSTEVVVTVKKKDNKPTKPKTTAPAKSTKPTASDLKKEGQRLKAEGMRQKGIGMAIKGKALRNKAIDNTLYKEKNSSVVSKTLIKNGANPKKPNLALKAATAMSESLGGLEMLAKGKNRYSNSEIPSKSKLTKIEKEALAKNKKTRADKQAKQANTFANTGKIPLYKKGGKTKKK